MKSMAEIRAAAEADPVRRARMARMRDELFIDLERFVFVDYNRIGMATRFSVRTLPSESAWLRRRFEAGQPVLVVGDDVSRQWAHIFAMAEDDRWIGLELVEVARAL